MKKLTLSVIVIVALAMSCTSTADIPGGFSGNVPDKEWKLTEVYISGRNTGFNRNTLVSAGAGGMFTLRFDSEVISGTGAPNRYNAPYTAGENKTISIAMVRATLMANINEPSSLREYDFFNYLQNAYKWDIVNNNLELLSRPDGREIRLVFSL
jgi:heat shock protein HslJ